MNTIPEVIINKITLYNSTLLCDLFKSRLKINGLMVLFRLNNKYIRLWHYTQDIPRIGSKWADNIEWKVQCYRNSKGFG